MSFLTRLILRHAGMVLLTSGLLTILGAYYSVFLFKNLRTDIEELLPSKARSVVDLNEISSRLESTTNLSLVVFSDFPDKAEFFLRDLARKLTDPPVPLVASVEIEVQKELEFFDRRKSLFIELEDLKRIQTFIHDKIEYEKELYNPINFVLEEEIPEPKLNVEALLGKYAQKTKTIYSGLPKGWYTTQDRKIHIAIINLAGKLSGVHAALELRNTVEKTIEALHPKDYAPDLRIEYTGDVQNLIDEHQALMEDLALSTVIVIFLVSLVMYLYFKDLRSTLILTLSLFAGTLWTFGVSYFAVGFLNANSAFLGNIVIGNGVNFGIIFLARYLEERRQYGRDVIRAIAIAMRSTWKGTLTAALAAGISYGSLVLTEFRGFSQFGIIGLIGMMLCWVSAYTVLPALLFAWHLWRPKELKKSKRESGFFFRGVSHLVGRFPLVILGLSLVISAVSAYSFRKIDSHVIETDLSKLRSKRSRDSGSMFYSQYVDQVFGRDLSPFILLPQSRSEARELVARLEKEQKENALPVSQILALDRFIPKEQAEKVQVLNGVRKLLTPEVRKHLNAKEKAAAESFLQSESLKPFSELDLPPLVKKKFTEKDGKIGNLVLVEVPLTEELKDGDRLSDLVARIRAVSDSVRHGLAMTGSRAVTSDLYVAIRRDGPRATLFAFLSVLVLVSILFRRPSRILRVLFTLILGILWMSGTLLLLGWKINFLNFIALPITFGIGVDYGVNLYQRYREEGRGRILHVLRHTGGALGLASLTTTIGYGSLLIASNQAFVSFGELAVTGEITCIFAALLTLPALLFWMDRKKMTSQVVLPEKPIEVLE